MDDPDIARMNAAIDAINNLTETSRLTIEGVDLLAKQNYVLIWITILSLKRMEETMGFNRASIADEVIASLRENFGPDEGREQMVRNFLGQGLMPSLPQKLSVIIGGRDDNTTRDEQKLGD